jgi:formamidopyrimidine-DNA glycosylase
MERPPRRPDWPGGLRLPELPEVEVVRRGLEDSVLGRTVTHAEVRHPRAVRRHAPGPDSFANALRGARFEAARRRGKYLWLPFHSADQGARALLAHLGMSGQLLARPSVAPDEPHLRVRVSFVDGDPELRFVDQRTFGALAVTTTDGGGIPFEIAHIALDPLDPSFDDATFIGSVRRRRTGIKRALLDQSLVSGVGNIYADEALWHARLHYARPTETMTRPEITRLLAAVRSVLIAALADRGTSFDSLYVDIDGSRGYFERSLQVYGRAGLPCPRCGTAIRKDRFMNRSSHICPRCQPRPRRARW